MASRKENIMKIKITEIRLRSFKNFHELIYLVESGRIYGRDGDGKTSLLNAIPACFLNCDMYGKKPHPLNVDATNGWVKLRYNLDDNDEVKSLDMYRTWKMSEDSIHSSVSNRITIHKSLFLAMLNPLYVFSLNNQERNELFRDLYYFDYTGDLLDELYGDIPLDVVKFAKSISPISIAKLNSLLSKAKDGIKKCNEEIVGCEHQLAILCNIPEAEDLYEDVKLKKEIAAAELAEHEQIKRSVDIINESLLSNARAFVEKSFSMAKLTEKGCIVYNDMPSEFLSSGEKIDCGLEIANLIASKYPLVPPTVIDDASACGHRDVDLSNYPYLSQILTASYADVDLCEHNGNSLNALDRYWKIPAPANFIPEVQIEMIPIS